MSEKELYGKSHNLVNVRVLKDEKYVGVYHAYLDGQEVHGVRDLTVNFRPQEIPETVLKVNSVPKVDHDCLVKIQFEPQDVNECIKYLALMADMDEDFKHRIQSSIYSALKDINETENNQVCDYDKAGYILDRLMRRI